MANIATSDAQQTMAVGAKPKPSQSKRMHRKSRFGCTNCKARKVKCDEASPACRNCTLRRTQCSYADAPGSGSSLSRWPMTPASMSPLGMESTSRPIISQPLFCPPAVDPVDMKLLWHYTANTCKSLSYEDNMAAPIIRTCQTAIVQHGFSSPFLLYSILELASLHMQSLGQQPPDASRAVMHRFKSYHGYLEAINEASPKAFGAMLANAVLLPMLSARNFRDPGSPDLYLLDWMTLWHGVPSIIHMTKTIPLEETGVAPLFVRPPLNPDVSVDAIPKPLLLMISFINPAEPDAKEMETYQESLRALGSLFENLKGPLDSRMAMRIMTWSTLTPRRLLELAQAGRERALIILAYYAVFLKLAQDIWWLRGVGDRSIRDICHVLGTQWHKYLEMPLAALVMEDTVELSRMIASFEERL